MVWFEWNFQFLPYLLCHKLIFADIFTKNLTGFTIVIKCVSEHFFLSCKILYVYVIHYKYWLWFWPSHKRVKAKSCRTTLEWFLWHRQNKQINKWKLVRRTTVKSTHISTVFAIYSPHLLHDLIICKNFPGLVSELPCTTQKAAASEQLLSGRSAVQDASIAARRHPLFTVQQPGPTTSTGPARIPGQWVSGLMFVPNIDLNASITLYLIIYFPEL